jgi:hypothetical protein
MSLTRSEQARLNGAKSSGPKTGAGKARSAMNAVKHGLSGARMAVLNNENDEAFQELFRDFIMKFQPQDAVEHECVLQAAIARWRLRRIWQIEAALFDAQMDSQAEQLRRQFESFDEGTRQALAFKAMADDSNSLSLLNRYERTISREYDRALKALDRARAESKYQPPTGDLELTTLAEQPESVAAPAPEVAAAPAAPQQIEKQRNEPNAPITLPSHSSESRPLIAQDPANPSLPRAA